jgi:thymidylate kinase
MNNVVFFSGTHGVGKTTTIEAIRDSEKYEILLASDGDHGNPYKENFRRQVWRINKYYLDSLDILEKSKEIDGNILLVDRCIFDHEAYTTTFHNLGWLSDEQYMKIERLRKTYYDSSIMPQNIVLFFPPEEWTKDRIKERWNNEKKKWNEGDFDYLHKLRLGYYDIFEREKNRRNVLVINETGFDLRVSNVREYISKLI